MPEAVGLHARSMKFSNNIIAFAFLTIINVAVLYLQLSATNLTSSSQTPAHAVITPSITKLPTDRPLILYAYHEPPPSTNSSDRQNLNFFINHGLHDNADFLFIINGDPYTNLVLPLDKHISWTKRKNTCWDLGSYAEVLLANNSLLLKKYKRFILLNSTIRGPFLPVWSKECWTDAYLRHVTDETKLVGMTYNCMPSPGTLQPHLQSMIFATDRVGMDIILKKDIIGRCFANWTEAREAEPRLSHAIIQAGYKINALMTAFHSDKYYIDNCYNDDVLTSNGYFGTNIHPYETLFHKTNRGFGELELALLTSWHDKMGYSSQKSCGGRLQS